MRLEYIFSKEASGSTMFTSLLEPLSIFQGFSQEQLNLLRPLFLRIFTPAGTVVFEQGNLAENLYILIDGEAAIWYKPEDGPALILSRLKQEGVFGWSAAIGSHQYTSTVICTIDSQLLRVRSLDLRQLCENHPETGSLFLERLASLIAERLRITHPQLMALLEQGLSVNIEKNVAAG